MEAEEALRLRLVEQVVEDAALDATALALCRRLAALPPVAVQAVKAAVRQSLEMPLSAGLAYENEMNVLCLSSLREGAALREGA